MLTRVGQRKRPFTDAYAFLLTARWPTVIALAGATFLAMNALFAFLYWIVPGSVENTDGSYLESFFFSVQTFAAIGYGFMYSNGVWGNSVMVVEAFCSLFCIALVTGIVFAKFSRPRARVLFSEPILIEQRNGVPTLTFRVANERGNDIVEASIRVAALITVHTDEGARLRRFYDLEVERASSPLFSLTWQIFHPITEESPLHGKSVDQLCEEDVRITVSLTGLDGTFSQTIHARHLYWAEEIVPEYCFVDVIEDIGGGRVQMDYRKFHLIEPQKLPSD